MNDIPSRLTSSAIMGAARHRSRHWQRARPALPRLSSALLLAAAGAHAMAADTAALRVVGRIVPAPCTVELGSNGNADFGTIAAADLPGDGMRKLVGQRSLPLSIRCTPANAPRLSFRDERPNSVPQIWDRLSTPSGRSSMFGLGRVDDKNIGMYLIHLGALKADGKDARLVRAVDGEAGWQFIDAKEVIKKENNYVWSTTAQPRAGAFGAIHGELVVKLWPEPLEELPLRSEIRLDGSAALVLEYP